MKRGTALVTVLRSPFGDQEAPREFREQAGWLVELAPDFVILIGKVESPSGRGYWQAWETRSGATAGAGYCDTRATALDNARKAYENAGHERAIAAVESYMARHPKPAPAPV